MLTMIAVISTTVPTKSSTAASFICNYTFMIPKILSRSSRLLAKGALRERLQRLNAGGPDRRAGGILRLAPCGQRRRNHGPPFRRDRDHARTCVRFVGADVDPAFGFQQ